MNAETVRSFIAIELPESVKNDLTGLENSLKAKTPAVVKWMSPDGIHLTLKFLGDVAVDGIDEVKMGIDEAVQGVSPFQLELQGVGAFPNLNRVQVIWVGVKGELDKLMYFQKQVEANMEQLGFPREERDFTPHLTLGRVRNYVSPDDRRKIGQVLGNTTFSSSGPINVEAVHLVKSQLTPVGAAYTSLYTALFK
ncbi:MAG: RNA 2',3'-cyclic phosphodiesterase [Dehalococcoidia bacterium]|nr:RNA 2',3'-cyclic phosphodiesterase [Dehalococcoidia bacterium]